MVMDKEILSSTDKCNILARQQAVIVGQTAF